MSKPETVRVICPHCRRTYDLTPEVIAKKPKATCGRCRKSFELTGATQELLARASAVKPAAPGRERAPAAPSAPPPLAKARPAPASPAPTPVPAPPAESEDYEVLESRPATSAAISAVPAADDEAPAAAAFEDSVTEGRRGLAALAPARASRLADELAALSAAALAAAPPAPPRPDWLAFVDQLSTPAAEPPSALE